MKALITGSEGFVGQYLKNELIENGYEVLCVDAIQSHTSQKIDILDKEMLESYLEHIEVDYVFHLAGQANVGKSWAFPGETFQVNVVGTINLLEAIRKTNPRTRVVLIGSSDEYGILREKGKNVTEEIQLNPITPYGISKAVQEKVAMLYVQHYDMDICLTRSFNHAGAGQGKGFIFSDFASGIIEVERGKSKCLKVGNLDSARDFTHVKDIVGAYRLIAEKGKKGEIYNVGSGKTHTVKDILEQMIAMAKVDIEIEQDRERLRPNDTPVVLCNHSKLTNHTGWVPRYDLEDIIIDVMDYWRSIL